MDSSIAIHEGTTFNKTSSLEGILDILLSKFKTENNAKNIISKNDFQVIFNLY